MPFLFCFLCDLLELCFLCSLLAHENPMAHRGLLGGCMGGICLSVVPTLWNTHPSELQSVPTLIADAKNGDSSSAGLFKPF